MSFGERPNDKAILKDVNKRLARAGIPGKFTAVVRGGCVTLAGALQYPSQRRIMIKKVNQAAGVRQVIDQMTVTVRKRTDMN